MLYVSAHLPPITEEYLMCMGVQLVDMPLLWAGDVYLGKFTWKIEHFTRLKELLKKRKITGLCIKSRRFQVGSRDCRLIVYPRGAHIIFVRPENAALIVLSTCD